LNTGARGQGKGETRSKAAAKKFLDKMYIDMYIVLKEGASCPETLFVNSYNKERNFLL